MTKIPVAILGATGAVGQRFVQLLEQHPWFEVAALAASEKRVGKTYQEACNWILAGAPSADMQKMTLQAIKPDLPARIIFSALPADVASIHEPLFAAAGYGVCSNASAFRYEADVPMIIPEVNADHLGLLDSQRKKRKWSGFIVTSPNCTTTGIAIPLKPLQDIFGIHKLFAVTMQAVSGAGYPGISSMDILGNVVPFIKGEEAKIERETCQLLGNMHAGVRVDADITVSVQVNRVPVLDGHTICLSVGLRENASVADIKRALSEFTPPPEISGLPGSPAKTIVVHTQDDRPQPRLDRDLHAGMAVSVGRIRPCPILDVRMLSVSHNTLRGAASGSILNAELLVAKGVIA